jgi:DNA topoisomerase-2
MQDFRAWQACTEVTAWNLKYYKGLGTSSSKEAREIFRALEQHTITLSPDAEAQDTLGKFYDEARVAERKVMLTENYDAKLSVDYSRSECSITEFMLSEHIHFSHYSIYRALPSAIDGQTPSRRKALFYFLASSKNQEVKVAQAGAGVAQRTMYLHGETSLVETLVGLAQDYVGTNNVALLQPLGQFGSPRISEI